MQSIAGDPVAEPRPRFTLDAAQRLVQTSFGVRGPLSPLDSERDQNFHVHGGQDFVLKISNPAEDPAVVDMQTHALLHLAHTDPDLPAPRICTTRDGASYARAEGADGRTSIVRLLTFLPGRRVTANDLDPTSLYELGSAIARVGRAMRGFHRPAAGRPLLFDYKHTMQAAPMVGELDGPEHQKLVARNLRRFEEHVLPVFPRLRAQVIHNDLTLENVLFDSAGRVGAILDFGDTVHTALVCDLASALASVLLERPDPAETAAAVIRGYRRRTPLEDDDLALLPDLLAARLALSVAWAAWRARRYPENVDYVSGLVDGAVPLLEWLEVTGRDAIGHALASDARSEPPVADGNLRSRRRVFGSALEPLSYDRPFRPVRAQGVWMFDAVGRRYLDAYNNVPHVGHCHPRVVHAIVRQTQTLNTNLRYLYPLAIELAERITATTPGLDVCMFVNSGSEANDLAWQLATAFTRERGAIATAAAYHGLTSAVADLSPAQGVRACDHVALLPTPDAHSEASTEDNGWQERHHRYLQDAIVVLASSGFGLAAYFADPFFTTDGIFETPPEYLQDVVRQVHDAGGLFVADEVQAGFGRTGTHWWSFQTVGAAPDIVTLGKSMGNGYPIGAVLTRPEIVDCFARTRQVFSTFGGNPVACAATHAVLDVIEEENLQAKAASVGSYLRSHLDRLAARHEIIRQVRGRGLLLGVELVRNRETREPASDTTRAVLNGMRTRGVLIDSTGPHSNILKIRPPMVFTREHADLFADTLDRTLDECAR